MPTPGGCGADEARPAYWQAEWDARGMYAGHFHCCAMRREHSLLVLPGLLLTAYEGAACLLALSCYLLLKQYSVSSLTRDPACNSLGNHFCSQFSTSEYKEAGFWHTLCNRVSLLYICML